jgi:Domain of unknown function (DUF4388)
MDERDGTADRRLEDRRQGQPERRQEWPPVVDTGTVSASASADEGKEPIMNQYESSEEAPAASLVGSLTVFSLADVLYLLASTKQTGEVHVVSQSVDGKVWLADGELSNAQVGTATTIGQAVFELACVTEGWFYFTAGVVSSSGQPTVPVAAVLNEVRPQVDEWREIRHDIPLEAIVTLAPNPPGADVQIRSDQWQVLATVGTSGYSVRTVLELIGGEQIVGLRTLRDLQAAGLIVVDVAAPYPPSVAAVPVEPASAISTLPPPPGSDPSGGGNGESGAAPAAGSDSGQSESPVDTLAEVTIMPPPIVDDPWAPAAEPVESGDNGVA